MKRFLIFTLALICAGFVISKSAQSAVPQLINYQGILTDAAGDPVDDDSYLVKFIIWDASAAGNDKWNSGFQNITTVDGLFEYILGSDVALPDDIFEDTIRYLGITVGADAEIMPRTRLVSAGYAYHALRADTAGIAVSVFPNSIGSAEVIDNSLTSADLGANSVNSSELATNAVLSTHIASGAVGSSEVADNSLTQSDLAANSVGSSEIAANAVLSTHIASGAVGSSEVADNSLTIDDLANSSVGSGEVLDNSLTQADLAANSVGASEIAPGSVGTSEVADNSLTAADLAANSVGASEIATNAVGASEIAANAVGQSEIIVGGVASSEVLNNSLRDFDILDEPGVAQFATGAATNITTDNVVIVASRIISCPTSGYVLAIASVEFGFSHVNGASSVYNLWVSQGTSQPTGQQKNIVWPSGMPSGFVRMIASVNHIFSVGGGNQTVNIVVDRSIGDPNYTIDDKTLSLVFIPTSYGTVTTAPPAGEENENEATDGGSN